MVARWSHQSRIRPPIEYLQDADRLLAPGGLAVLLTGGPPPSSGWRVHDTAEYAVPDGTRTDRFDALTTEVEVDFTQIELVLDGFVQLIPSTGGAKVLSSAAVCPVPTLRLHHRWISMSASSPSRSLSPASGKVDRRKGRTNLFGELALLIQPNGVAR